jgi:hypothetical protein
VKRTRAEDFTSRVGWLPTLFFANGHAFFPLPHGIYGDGEFKPELFDNVENLFEKPLRCSDGLRSTERSLWERHDQVWATVMVDDNNDNNEGKRQVSRWGLPLTQFALHGDDSGRERLNPTTPEADAQFVAGAARQVTEAVRIAVTHHHPEAYGMQVAHDGRPAFCRRRLAHPLRLGLRE